MSEKGSEHHGAREHLERGSSDTPVSRSSAMRNTDVDEEQGTNGISKEDIAEPEVFDWSGPDDRSHPHNWPRNLKLYIGFILTIITMIVSINSSIYNTGAEQEEKEFDISAELNLLGTSLFLVVSAASI